MPTNVYGTRGKKFVVPFTGSTVNYGFATNIDSTDSTEAGHQDVSAATGIVIFGANSPKPARGKKLATSTVPHAVTTFIDADKVATPSSGWIVIARAKFRGIGSGSFSKAVYVTFNGYKYAWNMAKRLYDKIGSTDLTAMGIQDCDPKNYKDYLWGSNSLKPPRASNTTASTSGVDVLSTFYDPDKTLPSGWSASSAGKLPS